MDVFDDLQKSFQESPKAILMNISVDCVRAELLELPGREDFFDLGDICDISTAEEVLVALYSTCVPLRILGLGGDNSASHFLIENYLRQKQRQNVTAAILYFDTDCRFQIGGEITRFNSDSIIDSLRQRGVQEFYTSFDMSVQEKLSLDPILLILKKLTSQFPLTGADLIGISPFSSMKRGVNPEPDATLAMGAMMSNFFLTELNRSIKT